MQHQVVKRESRGKARSKSPGETFRNVKGERHVSHMAKKSFRTLNAMLITEDPMRVFPNDGY